MEVDGERGAAGKRGVPTLAVGDGTPDGEPGEPAEDLAPEPSRHAHLPAHARIPEAVSLHVVGVPLHDRQHDGAKVIRIHLTVTRHHGDDVVRMIGLRDRGAVSGRDRRAHAATAWMADHADARICGIERGPSRRVAASVVDDEDAVDERGHRRDHTADELLLLERGDDDDDAAALDHPTPRSRV